MAAFVSVREDEEKEGKMKKVSQFLKCHNLGIMEVISLKFGMWTTDGDRCFHSKNVLFNKGSTENA